MQNYRPHEADTPSSEQRPEPDELRDLPSRLHAAEEALAEAERRYAELARSLPEIVNERDRAVHISEARFRAVFQRAAIGMSITGADTRILQVNPAFERMLGYSQEELRGKPFADLTHPDDIALNMNLYQELVEGKRESFQIEKRYIRKDGRLVWARLTVSLAAPAPDESAFSIGMIEDVTNRKLLEEQLLRAQRLEAAGRVAGQVAHDFNNLLGPLVGYPDLMKRMLPHNHPAVAMCDVMLEAAEQMAEINEDMMALGRRGLIDGEPVDVNKVVQRTMLNVRDEIKGLEVRLQLTPNLPSVTGSPAQLQRAVVNLVRNAIEAMQESVSEGRTATLGVATEVVDRPDLDTDANAMARFVQITVSDTGPGVPAGLRTRVFDAFFTTRRGGRKRGSGLGLAIVQAIVEDHRGRVELDSEVGVGTTFCVYLPAGTEVVEIARSEMNPRGTEMILVVDDDPYQRDVMQGLLQSIGYLVKVASSGEDALIQLEAQAVDLLLLDMMMPDGIDGVETYRRALALRAGQKAIMVSGHVPSPAVQEARFLGAGPFLRKPVSLATLAQAVRNEIDRTE